MEDVGELPEWGEVTTIILVDHKGMTYRVSRSDLMRFLKPWIEETLRELWNSLTEEAGA